MLKLLCFFAVAGLAAAQCPVLKDADRARLAGYVQKKYKLAPTMPIGVADIGFVGETCYRKLRFESEDRRRPFQAELVASPDLRFLTRELLDSQIDPVEEERSQERAVMDALRAAGGASLGPKDAPVTITLFSDFQCPYCAQMASGLTNDILPAEADHVRVVFHNFPLAMHPWARPAAEAAECARAQGDRFFWSFHDYIFEHQKEITPENVRQKVAEHALDLTGFDVERFSACLESGGGAPKVDADLQMGRRIGITGTPTFFVNGARITGYRRDQIRTVIRQLTTPLPSSPLQRGAPRNQEPEPERECSPLKCQRPG